MYVRITAAALLGAAMTSSVAFAFPGEGGKVYSPYVIDRKFEFENRYSELVGGAADGEAAYVAEVEYGFTTYWLAGLEIEIEREAGENFDVEAIEFETVFELDEIPGTGIEFGLFGEYEDNLHGGPSAIEVRLLFADESGPFRWIANLHVEHVMGDDDETEFGYSGFVAYTLFDRTEIALETFGDLGTSDHFGDLGDQEAFLGPVIFTKFADVADGVIEVEAGYLFALGASQDETDGQARLIIEWEKTF